MKMIRRGFTIFIFLGMLLVCRCSLQAQSHDKVWAVGFPISLMTFDPDSLRLSTLPDSNIRCFLTLGSICDRSGKYQFCTNGVGVYNRDGQKMPHGDSLSYPSEYYDQIYLGGMPGRQGVLVLENPADSDQYYIFHYTPTDTLHSTLGYEALNFYYSLVDMKLDSGKGDLIQKNIPLIQNEMLSYSRLSACKHANGRDWWIIKNACSENIYYKFLITPNGVSGPFVQQIGPKYGHLNEKPSYALFNPNGTKYVSFTDNSYVVIMDFDRCSGEFSNPDSIFNSSSSNPSQFPNSGGSSAAISPNGRFLYINNRLELNQYDLWSSRINDSVRIVTLNDTSDFFQMNILQLAPNGKIYISLWNGGTKSIHVINDPDSFGFACNFQMYSQPVLSINPLAIPYFPNYRLGALPGQCDTLTATEDIRTAHPAFASLYPNPSTDKATISYYSGVNTSNFINVSDVEGRVIWSSVFSGSNGTVPINVSAMSAGVYIVTFVSDGISLLNTKLIVTH